jgi:uncharacterized membrane protein YeaQ/YmgE (transglycosylase-associated protein family)
MTLMFGFILFLVTNALVSSALALGLSMWLPNANRLLRSLLAAVIGPISVGTMILVRDGAEWEKMLLFSIIVGVIGAAICFPCAYLTSLWRDRLRVTQETFD